MAEITLEAIGELLDIKLAPLANFLNTAVARIDSRLDRLEKVINFNAVETINEFNRINARLSKIELYLDIKQ